MHSLKIYGYFTSPDQSEPAYEPGLEVDCPICHERLSHPMKTVSLMLEGDNRSYFYRVHKSCFENLSDVEVGNLDGLILDAVIASKNTN